MIKQISYALDRIIEDSNYSQKGHFCAAFVYGYIHMLLGVAASILSFVAVSIILANSNKLMMVACISLFAGILTTISTFVNPDKKNREHLKAGNLYLALRNDSRIFKDIEIAKFQEEKAIEKIKAFNERRNRLNCESPQIPGWAFWKSKKNIEKGQLKYQVDNEEIL